MITSREHGSRVQDNAALLWVGCLGKGVKPIMIQLPPFHAVVTSMIYHKQHTSRDVQGLDMIISTPADLLTAETDRLIRGKTLRE